MAWTAVETDSAAGAGLHADRIAPPRAELDDGIFGTRGIAVVALVAVAARRAALRLVSRLRGVEPGHDLGKVIALCRRQFRLMHGECVAVHRQGETPDRESTDTRAARE